MIVAMSLLFFEQVSDDKRIEWYCNAILFGACDYAKTPSKTRSIVQDVRDYRA
jgi:hypothetical protein